MSYSIISALALVINLIINRGALKIIRDRSGERKNEQDSVVRYRYFLIAANLYFIADIGWGILYEHRDMDALFPALYFDCYMYFLFMFLTMLTWIRYIVAYLDKRGRRSKTLLYAVWAIFTLTLINLVIN